MTTYTQGGQFRSFTAAGAPNISGLVYTYAAGTLTPLATYVTPSGSANANPVVLGVDGAATICLADGVNYRIRETTAAGVLIKDTDNIITNGALADLASTASGKGAALVGYLPSGTGAAGTTVQAKLREAVSVLDFGADPTGVVGSSSAIQAALAASGFVWIPDGAYLIDADITLEANKFINFSKGATFKASANGRTFFKVTVSAYYSQIWNANLDGNGKTSVTGFDVSNMRLAAGLFNCSCATMNIGVILRTGCFGTQLLNFNTTVVPNPIQVLANASTLDIIHPTLDNGSSVSGTLVGIGIDIRAGAGDNLGVRVVGGYIQGFATGVQDAGIGTKITDTYFETNTAADVSGVAARCGTYSGLQLFGPSGSAGVKLRNCDAMTVFNPTMASGARTVLYDVDSTNTNCAEYRTASNASYNLPLGSLTYLGSVPTQTIGTFTPVVVGSSTAGAGTYSVQAGKWSKTGNVVHFDLTIAWSAHTGTGNITVTGLPSGLAPALFTPNRNFLATTSGLSFTGPVLFGTLIGSGTTIGLQQLTVAGVVSLVPIAGSGTLNITGSFEI